MEQNNSHSAMLQSLPESTRPEISYCSHCCNSLSGTPINNIGFKAASKAYQDSFGKTPIPQRSGGSIPIVALFEQELKSKTILMGFGLDSDAIHSPNEHFGVFNYLKGIETIPLFYKYFTELSK